MDTPRGGDAAEYARLVRHLDSLLEVSKAMASAIDLDSLLGVIQSEATQVMDAERGTIFIHDEGTGTLWNRVSGGLAPGLVRVAVGTGIAGHVAKDGRVLNVPDAYGDSRFNPEVDRQTSFRTRSILCAPIFGHGRRLLGVIQVLNKAGGGVFTRDDEVLMEAFASHAALALDRARLVEAFVEKQRIEEGLRLARDIQRAMLPRRFPAQREFELMAEVRPARSVGGDFYDFFVDRDRLWFLVGDVSGKGMAAALFMAVAKTLFHAGVQGESSPSAVFAKVNRELCRDNDDAMFVTVFAGCLDLRTGEVVAGNAGHHPPYRLGREGAVTKVAGPSGVPLGVRDGDEYMGGTLRLEPGEGLYLYTDGITEALNERGEQFSDSRLEAYLRGASGATAAEVVRGSLAVVQDFVGGSPPFDDITVMSLRYLGG